MAGRDEALEMVLRLRDEASRDLAKVRDALDRVGDSAHGAGQKSGFLHQALATATGFGIIQGIQNLASSVMGLAGSAFEAVASYERLGMSLETLVAREIKNASGVEEVITVGQRRVELTDKQREKLEELRTAQEKYAAQLAVDREHLAEAIARGKDSAAEIELRRVRLGQLEGKLADTTAAIAALEAQDGKLVDVTQKVITGQLSMGEALAQAGPKAKELLHWIEMVGIKSPFSSEGVAQAFRTAMAYGFTADEAKRLTQANIDFAAGSGASAGVMNQIALALGQMKARGKVAGQEILQLVNAGVPVREILAKAFGVTTEQLTEMQEKGLIPADKAIQAIVQSLESDFGGAAERQATSLAGLSESLKELKTIGLRELFTGVFQAAQPYVAAVVDLLSSESFRTSLQQVGRLLGEKVAAGLEWLGRAWAEIRGPMTTGLSMLRTLWRLLASGNMAGFMNMAGVALGSLRDLLAEAGENLMNWVEANLPAWLEALSRMGMGLAQWVVNALPGLLEALGQMGLALMQWVIDAIPGLLEAAGELGAALVGWVTNLLPSLLQAFSTWGRAVVSWLLEAQPSVFKAIGDFLQKLIGAVMAALPDWAAALLKFGLEAVQWIVAQLPALANNLGQFFNRMVNWVAENLPTWVAELQKLALAAIDWVVEALPGLAENLGLMAGTLLRWIVQTAIDVVPELVKLAGKFLAWVATDVLPRLPSVLGEILVAILKFLAGLLTAIDPEIGKVATGIVEGLARGIRNAADAVRRALKDIIDAALGWIKRTLGIESPSTVAAEMIGLPLALGIAQGLRSGLIELQRGLPQMLQPLTMPLHLQPALAGGLPVPATPTGLGAAAASAYVAPVGNFTFVYAPTISLADEAEARERLAPVLREVLAQEGRRG